MGCCALRSRTHVGGGVRCPRCARGVGCARARRSSAGGLVRLVRLLLSSVPLARRACVVLSSSPSRSQRAPAGVKRQPGTLPKSQVQATQPNDRPQSGRSTSRIPSHPKGPGAEIAPRLRPNAVPSAHYHFAPPSRAARSRRPLVSSTRAARSRCPLAPPSRAARLREARRSNGTTPFWLVTHVM